MKISELKAEVQKYQYLEDTNIINISLASIISTRLGLGDPIWLVIIGPSSGGKSQILRPLALTDPKFLHRIDDLTENTFLSASQGKGEQSLLKRIGPKGMLVISDMTVLFSKNVESRNTILSQFRMIYDGEMVKFSGNSDKAITWKGHLGIIAGSTPSLYAHFEEVADMGERFIYYRMKEYDAKAATKLSMSRTIFGKKLDETLSDLYADYIEEVVKGHEGDVILSENVNERILHIAMLTEKIRTPVKMNWHETDITHIPIPAMPMRVALQLTAIAKALMIIRKHEDGGTELTEDDIGIIDWCGYSLANEEKRACLKILASIDYMHSISGQSIGDKIGLSTTRTNYVLQNLASVGVVQRAGADHGLTWRIESKIEWETIRRIEAIDVILEIKDRELSNDEVKEKDELFEDMFNKF